MTAMTRRQWANCNSLHKAALNIVAATPHGCTHFSSLSAKNILIKFCRTYSKFYLEDKEMFLIARSEQFHGMYGCGNTGVTLQFLIDLVTYIMYEQGIDVYETVLKTNRSYE